MLSSATVVPLLGKNLADQAPASSQTTAGAPHEPVASNGWFAELKRRRVVRTLVGYGIASFAVLQVIEPIMHGLHWPETVLSYVVVALAAGFPVVITLAWIFDVKAGRIERTAPAAAATGLRGIRLASLLLGIGVLAAAPGLAWYFLFRSDTRIVARKRGEPAGTAERKSIAVLPFVNMSSDKENEYFSDGITEEVINALANVDGLRVASRTSAFAFKGKDVDIRQLGEKLNVGAVLEGSVRREGDRLRITAQLINVADDYHVWSRTYERELKNVFEVEEELARSIAQALTPKLIRSESAPLVKPSTSSLDAHDLYLQGRYFNEKRTAKALREAAGFFAQATEKDPGYALAWVGLADATALQTQYGPERASTVLPKARESVLRALKLDPHLAEAQATVGLIAWFSFEWADAERAYRKMIELNPNYAAAHHWYAILLSVQARFSEAYAEIDRAYRLDPGSPIINNLVAMNRYWARDFDGAIEAFRKAFEIDPAFPVSHGYLGDLYAAQGRYAAADAEFDKGSPSLAERGRGVMYAQTGRRAEALRIVEQVEQRARRGYSWPAVRGFILVALGEKDRGYDLLMQACAEKDWLLLDTKVEPLLDKMHPDPRFHDLLKCMHLE
jgi:serine/threonine-protein kinase